MGIVGSISRLTAEVIVPLSKAGHYLRTGVPAGTEQLAKYLKGLHFQNWSNHGEGHDVVSYLAFNLDFQV